MEGVSAPSSFKLLKKGIIMAMLVYKCPGSHAGPNGMTYDYKSVDSEEAIKIALDDGWSVRLLGACDKRKKELEDSVIALKKADKAEENKLDKKQGFSVVDIAKTCHEVNRAYCAALGDDSQLPWKDAPEWQKESAINGVMFHVEHPEAGPEHIHENWYKEKEAAGWSYGETKDEEKKEHPCFVPYGELPVEQKAKDYIFRAIIHALSSHIATVKDDKKPEKKKKGRKKEG
jgi:hypothetical protein